MNTFNKLTSTVKAAADQAVDAGSKVAGAAADAGKAGLELGAKAGQTAAGGLRSSTSVDEQLTGLFTKVDTDGSGTLRRGEVATLARELGLELSETELDQAMSEMDDDSSGDVDYEEFSSWWKAAQQSDGGGGSPRSALGARFVSATMGAIDVASHAATTAVEAGASTTRGGGRLLSGAAKSVHGTFASGQSAAEEAEAEPPRKRVVVTGACGYVASLMMAELHERYELVLLDIVKPRGEGTAVDVPGVAGRTQNLRGGIPPELEVQIADLSQPIDSYRQHFTGADAVIHCGFGLLPPGGAEGSPLDGTTWANEYANIAMAHNVYQVAMEEGVKRVVVASSNHAADFYEPLIHSGQHDHLRADTYNCGARPLADNLYGWCKETYEHLGFLYAVGKGMPRQLEMVQVRIGAPKEDTFDTLEPGDLSAMNRFLGAYLSARDCAQLFIKSIDTADIRDEYGIPFQTFYGISANYNKFWSISNARRVIGYEPQDNALVKYSTQVAEFIAQAKETSAAKETSSL